MNRILARKHGFDAPLPRGIRVCSDPLDELHPVGHMEDHGIAAPGLCAAHDREQNLIHGTEVGQERGAEMTLHPLIRESMGRPEEVEGTRLEVARTRILSMAADQIIEILIGPAAQLEDLDRVEVSYCVDRQICRLREQGLPVRSAELAQGNDFPGARRRIEYPLGKHGSSPYT